MKLCLITGIGLALLATTVVAAEPRIHSDLDPDPTKGLYASDPTQCLGLEGRPDIRVRARDLRSGDGIVRFVLYGDKPDEFLEKGKKLLRLEVPARKDGVEVCLSAPRPGVYALAVLHDENGNRKFNMTSDGGGFSNNPKLFLGPPSFEESRFEVDETGGELEIEIKYMLPERDDSRRFRRR
ncbi:MAG: DUF2141 domain-containing protein [Alphaproteobacteria bacterium]|nr:MAG: DUF2141 domain-containing protein [Alphaproteobacteria bacterium]